MIDMTQSLLKSIIFLICLKDCGIAWNYGNSGVSLSGKVLVLNTMASSKSIYVVTMTAPPNQFTDEANWIQKEFFGTTNDLKSIIVL